MGGWAAGFSLAATHALEKVTWDVTCGWVGGWVGGWVCVEEEEESGLVDE